MAFLNKLSKDETLDSAKEENQVEEQYQKMFKKIARDFLTKEDFKEIMQEMIANLNLTSLVINTSTLDLDQNAIKIANEYEANSKRSSQNKKKYKDIK